MSSFAQIKGSLTIYAKEGEKIWVIKNGVKQNAEAQTSVTVKDIADKYFKIKVIVDDEKMSSVDKQIQMVDVDGKMCNITYELKMKKSGYTLSIISWDPIDSQTTSTTTSTSTTTEPETQTTTTNVTNTDFHQNTNMGQGGVNQTTTAGQTQTNVNMGQNGANMTIKDPEMGVDFNMNMNVPNGQGNVTSTTTTTTTTTSSSSSTVNGKPANNGEPMKHKPQPTHQNQPQPDRGHHSNGCYAAMPASEFAEAKEQVKKASFADDKIRIAKQITEANCLSVAQIKEIAKLFSFEDNKLDYLKFAYDFTFEKKKYYMVNDVLNFSSSKEELDNYIKSKR
jgi:hypothetical protein